MARYKIKNKKFRRYHIVKKAAAVQPKNVINAAVFI